MLPVLISLLAGFATYFAYVGIWRKRQASLGDSAVQQRLREFEQQSRLGNEIASDPASPEHRASLGYKLGAKVGDLLNLDTGGISLMQKIDEKLILSGRPRNWYAQDWLAFSVLVMGTTVIGGGFLTRIGFPSLWYLGLVGLSAYYCYWELTGRIKLRQEQARFELPYFLDELIMSLSSGSGSLDLSLRDIIAGDTAIAGGRDTERVLVTEFRRAYQEFSNQAKTFEDAYRDAASRIQVQPVDDLVEVLVEGQASGAPIVNVLRDMARQVYVQFEQDMNTLIKKKDSTFTVATVLIMLGAAVVIGAPIFQSVNQALSGAGGIQ